MSTLEKQKLEQDIEEADIVCTTCCNVYNPLISEKSFEYILVDEAAQATEPECLIPIIKARSKVILIRDPCQLRPTITSKNAKAEGLDVSMFERLVQGGVRPHMLKIQHRMVPKILEIASSL